MNSLSWRRQIDFLKIAREAYWVGKSPWGEMTIFTKSGLENSLIIEIAPEAGGKLLTNKKIQILQQLFSSLTVSLAGDSGMQHQTSESVPNKIIITLEKSTMPPNESFEASSRSLVTTLLIDPEGLLGLNPQSVNAK